MLKAAVAVIIWTDDADKITLRPAFGEPEQRTSLRDRASDIAAGRRFMERQ